MKKWFHWFHTWQYFSGGRFDKGVGYGLRYRQCQECLRTQIFSDFAVEYVDID